MKFCLLFFPCFAFLLLWGPSISADGPLRSESLLRIAESAEISATASGIIQKLIARDGEIIQTGALMAELDARQAQAELRTAQNEAKIANAEMENTIRMRLVKKASELAKTELERAHNVNRGLPNSVSERDVNILRLTLEKSLLEIEQSKYEKRLSALKNEMKQDDVRSAKDRLDRFKINAPLDGMVVNVRKNIGEWVDVGEPLATIVQVDKIRAEAFLPASHASWRLMKRPATIHYESAGGQLLHKNGHVVFVSPEANPVDGSVRVWADFDNHDLSLRPGLRAQLTIQPKASKVTAERNVNRK